MPSVSRPSVPACQRPGPLGRQGLKGYPRAATREGPRMADIGFVGLGKMGGSMVARLRRAGHRVFVFDQSRERAEAVAKETGAGVVASLDGFAQGLAAPRAV